MQHCSQCTHIVINRRTCDMRQAPNCRIKSGRIASCILHLGILHFWALSCVTYTCMSWYLDTVKHRASKSNPVLNILSLKSSLTKSSPYSHRVSIGAESTELQFQRALPVAGKTVSDHGFRKGHVLSLLPPREDVPCRTSLPLTLDKCKASSKAPFVHRFSKKEKRKKNWHSDGHAISPCTVRTILHFPPINCQCDTRVSCPLACTVYCIVGTPNSINIVTTFLSRQHEPLLRWYGNSGYCTFCYQQLHPLEYLLQPTWWNSSQKAVSTLLVNPYSPIHISFKTYSCTRVNTQQIIAFNNYRLVSNSIISSLHFGKSDKWLKLVPRPKNVTRPSFTVITLGLTLIKLKVKLRGNENGFKILRKFRGDMGTWGHDGFDGIVTANSQVQINIFQFPRSPKVIKISDHSDIAPLNQFAHKIHGPKLQHIEKTDLRKLDFSPCLPSGQYITFS